jgi:ABC-2 type transport system permease protein
LTGAASFRSDAMQEPMARGNPISLMSTAMRALMAGNATLSQVALSLVAPVVLTVILAPVTLWLYRRQ